MKYLKTKLLKLFITYKQALSTLGILCLFFFLMLASQFVYGLLSSSDSGETSSEYSEFADSFSDSEEFDCNVFGIEIRGELATYVSRDKDGNKLEYYEDTTTSDDVVYYIGDAVNNDDIKGVLIDVDSFGGSAVAGEEIANEIKFSQKPVVVFIRDVAASASYLAISSADRIFASKYSDVGGIGVTMSYLDNISKNQKDGYSFVQLSAGKFKDSGSPDKVLTQEERDLFMRDLKIAHETFIQTVSENRNLAIEKVREIADGSTVMGEKAIELGLIDEIGGYDEAVNYLEEQIGEEISVLLVNKKGYDSGKREIVRCNLD